MIADRTVRIANPESVDRELTARLAPSRITATGQLEVRLPVAVRPEQWTRLVDALHPHLDGPPDHLGVIQLESEEIPESWGAIEGLIERHLEQGYGVWMDARRSLANRATRHGREVFLAESEVDHYFPAESGSGPPLDLIVRIGSECGSLVSDLCRNPRSILRRRRVRQPLDRVQQVDNACIRWLASQPGRTIAEKAGPTQKILGVVREQSIDTLENRVLRDFLTRCRHAANQYLKMYASKPSGLDPYQRIETTRVFLRTCDSLLARSPVGTLPAVHGSVSPNYALQFDRRYCKLWHWYEQLVRRENQIATAIPWCDRLLIERLGIDLSRRLRHRLGTHFTNQARVREEHRFGSLLGGSLAMTMGPFDSRECGRYILDLIPGSCLHDAILASKLDSVGDGDLVLHAHPPFEPDTGRVLVVRISLALPDNAFIETEEFTLRQDSSARDVSQRTSHALDIGELARQLMSRTLDWLGRPDESA